jgi:phosphoglycolate/pyridoxal phosphate phosphatase family enzyme
MTSTKNNPKILEFDPSYLSKYDNIIFDMDGVIWHGTQFLNGICESLKTLQKMDKKIFFCTNNSTKHRSSYYPKFESVQLDVPKDILYTSASTAASYVFYEIFGGIPADSDTKVLVIGESGLLQEFYDLGLSNHILTIDDMRKGLTTLSLAGLKNYQVDSNIKCVCTGLRTDFSYSDCAIAVMVIRENNAKFISTNRDVTFPISSTRQLPGAGSVVNMIAGSVQNQPQVMGKPTKFMKDAIVRDHGIDLSRTLMVGDRLDTDISFGNEFGMDTMLVFSGVTDREVWEIEHDIIGLGDGEDEENKCPNGRNFDQNDHLVQNDNQGPQSPLSDPKSPLPEPTNPRLSAIPTYCAPNITWLVQKGGMKF